MGEKRESSVLAARVAGAACALCAVLAMGAVLVWAPPCGAFLELANGNMVPMRCAYTGKVALLVGLVLLGVSLAAVVRGRMCVPAMLGLSAALFLLAFDTPVSIGVCRSETMQCQATAAWLMGCGAVSALASVGATAVGGLGRQVRA